MLAADVLDGALRYEPTRKEIAEIFRVNASYVDVARTLSPVKRAAILNGWDAISFVDLRAHTPALPKPITANGNAVDDAALLAIARHNPNRLWNALQTAETVVAVGAAE